MINFKKEHPDALIGRLMIMQHFYLNHTPDECEATVKGTATVEELFDDKGEPALFFNWEAMLFNIPLQELDHLAFKLNEKEIKSQISQGIKVAQIQDELDKNKILGFQGTSEGIWEAKLAEAKSGLVDAKGNPLTPLPVGQVKMSVNSDELINPGTVEEKPRMVIHMNNSPALPVLPTSKDKVKGISVPHHSKIDGNKVKQLLDNMMTESKDVHQILKTETMEKEKALKTFAEDKHDKLKSAIKSVETINIETATPVKVEINEQIDRPEPVKVKE